MGKKLFVGNLANETSEEALRGLFESVGVVNDCELVIDNYSGRFRGFGFVEMATDDDAQNAIKQFDGSEFLGRNLAVNEARPRTERAPVSGFKGRGQKKRRSGKGSRRGIRSAKRARKASW
jgi:RNA recognition motif-containing protein